MKNIINTMCWILMFCAACNFTSSTKQEQQQSIKQKPIPNYKKYAHIDSLIQQRLPEGLVFQGRINDYSGKLPEITGFDLREPTQISNRKVIVNYEHGNEQIRMLVHFDFDNRFFITYTSITYENSSDNSIWVWEKPVLIELNAKDYPEYIGGEIASMVNDSVIKPRQLYTDVYNMDLNLMYEYAKKIKKLETSITNEHLEYLLRTEKLSNQTVIIYNDIAFYLEKGMAYEQSILLLSKIVEEFPQRTVAFINLGDAYWGLGKKYHAQIAYKKYVLLMNKSGKENKIPKRVLERLSK